MSARKLNLSEIALCRKIFGNAIDYDRVRVHRGKYMPLQPDGCSMAPNGHLYMANNFLGDYAHAGPFWRTHFIHEMAHVWQYQNKVLNPVLAAIGIELRHPFNYSAGYQYTLVPGKDLVRYNMEQQASIIEDFYRITAEGDDRHTGRCMNGGSVEARLALYHAVLGNFLRDPAYANKKRPKPPSA